MRFLYIAGCGMANLLCHVCYMFAVLPGRRQRGPPSLRRQRVRRYGQCWMSPGHQCSVLSVSYLRSMVKVLLS